MELSSLKVRPIGIPQGTNVGTDLLECTFVEFKQS